MLEILALVFLVVCGAVMVLTARVVLHVCGFLEISSRSVAALLLGAAGAWCIVRALTGPTVAFAELLLPACVLVYIVGAMWRRHGAPARRVTDLKAQVDRAPWIGSPGR